MLLLTLFAGSAMAASGFVPAPPKIAATSYLLLDSTSGHVLVRQNEDKRVEPASLTKLMTAYAVFKELKNGNIKLDEEVLISKKAWKMGGSRMFVEVAVNLILFKAPSTIISRPPCAAGSLPAISSLLPLVSAAYRVLLLNCAGNHTFPKPNPLKRCWILIPY